MFDGEGKQTGISSWIVAAAALTFACLTTACGGGGVGSTLHLNSTLCPLIDSVVPQTLPLEGGVTVEIAGSNFEKGATVTIGGIAAVGVSVNSFGTSITATAPPHDEGQVDVIVTNPDGKTTMLAGRVKYKRAPKLKSVSPSMGPTAGGSVVTVQGTSFQSGARVTFGGVAATVLSGLTSEGQTQVAAPPHPAGKVNVAITNPDGLSDTLQNGYSYTAAPTIAAVSPSSGPTAGGTVVTITGGNFQGGATVSFGGVTASSLTVSNPSQIQTVSPPHAAGTVEIKVTNPDGQSAILSNSFTYNSPSSITSVSPNSGPVAGGTTVTITGSNFQSGATANFGGTAAASVTVVNATQVQAVTPAHSGGSVDVTVTNPGGATATLAGGFTFIAPPEVSSISPTSGPTAGGTLLVITGNNFQSGATVLVGATAGTGIVVNSATQIQVVTPAHSAGVVNIVVRNPDAQSSTLAGAFTYVAAPLLISLSPASGPSTGGTTVTLNGNSFQSRARVSFGGTNSSQVTFVSSTGLVAVTPAHTAGVVNVTVQNPDNQIGTLSSAFTYNPAPTINDVTPNAGPAGGGTPVTLTGSNYQSGATVSFGGVNSTAVTFINVTQLHALTPAHAAGAVNVVVTNPDSQSAMLSGGFTYNVAPTIASASPSSGPAAGGTAVTITGTSFQSGASVSFGGSNSSTVTYVSSTQLMAVTQVHAAGTVDIVVTNPDRQAATLAGGFTYNSSPTISGISPSSGPATGGTSVVITGSDFQSGAIVSLGRAAATSVTVSTTSQIQAVTPSSSAGTVDVTVTNPDGQSGTLAGSFIFTSPHSVTLGWTASTSVAAGYNIYRGTTSGGPYAKLNSSLVTELTYTDSTVQAGQMYCFVATAVDLDNVESAYSNEAQAVVPSP